MYHTSHRFKVRAFNIVSAVVNVLDITTTRVVAGFKPEQTTQLKTIKKIGPERILVSMNLSRCNSTITSHLNSFTVATSWSRCTYLQSPSALPQGLHWTEI